MKKLTRFSLYMTENCWGSAANHFTSRWLADALLRAIELKEMTPDDLHFGTDQEIWEKLIQYEDPIIQKNIEMILNASTYFSIVEKADAEMIIKSKFRGIDPWILLEKPFRLTELDKQLADEFKRTKEIINWPVKVNEPCVNLKVM